MKKTFLTKRLQKAHSIAPKGIVKNNVIHYKNYITVAPTILITFAGYVEHTQIKPVLTKYNIVGHLLKY